MYTRQTEDETEGSDVSAASTADYSVSVARLYRVYISVTAAPTGK